MKYINTGLLAMFALSSLAGTANAQSSVTLFGLVDMGLRIDQTSGGRTASLQSGMGSGSRFGFRGVEDLGGGLKALYWLEAGFQADTGVLTSNGAASPGFGRQSYVGLSSNTWGDVTLGRQYTPIFNLMAGRVDPLGFGFLGGLTNSIGLQAGAPARADNAVVYASPELAGFRGELMWSFGESSVANVPGKAGEQRGASISYRRPSFEIGYAYHETQGTRDVSVTPHQRRQAIGSVIDFDFAKLHLAYSTNKNDALGAALIDRRNYGIGVSVPMFGAGKFIAQYQKSDDRRSADADVQQLSLTFDYFLSKRTDVYASVAKTDNRNSAAFGLTDATNATLGSIAPGSNPSALQVGVRHRF